jgi:hypothetical protein
VGRGKAAREATIRGAWEMQSSRHSTRVAAGVGHGAERLGVEVDGPEHLSEDAIAERIRKAYVADEVSRATQTPFTDKGSDG